MGVIRATLGCAMLVLGETVRMMGPGTGEVMGGGQTPKREGSILGPWSMDGLRFGSCAGGGGLGKWEP